MIPVSIIGAAVWLFLACDPSPIIWILALLFLSYAMLGYVYLSLTIFTFSPEEIAGAVPLMQITQSPSSDASLDPAGGIAVSNQDIMTAAGSWGLDKKGRS